jgi:hypothetical protein
VREADYSPASSTEVKNAWHYTSTPQCVFITWCLVKHKDNFTFTFIRGCIQKFPDWVDNEITIINTREATQRVMAAKLTRLTHKIAIQLYLVAESCTTAILAPGGQSRNFWIHLRIQEPRHTILNYVKYVYMKDIKICKYA